ncbi:MAG TPA: rhodanese-like domain-containing protein [Ignavibacteriaceae bacterium]|nr:rhodanese-like domain-containing protein [Ignavibacteriaceae bacterium]
MKIQIPELLELLKKDKVQFVDVRFKEEFELWHFSFSKNIPLNEMPDRLAEINKDKLVVTACPHYDRAIMGRIFLMQNGFNARYLVEGLLGLADYLRGDIAKNFYNSIKKSE